LDVDIYGRLAEAGALQGLDVELPDGLLVNRHPHGPNHGVRLIRSHHNSRLFAEINHVPGN
jgi:hypothetical protein